MAACASLGPASGDNNIPALLVPSEAMIRSAAPDLPATAASAPESPDASSNAVNMAAGACLMDGVGGASGKPTGLQDPVENEQSLHLSI